MTESHIFSCPAQINSVNQCSIIRPLCLKNCVIIFELKQVVTILQ